MKIIKLIDGKEYIITEETAENVKVAIRRGGFIELENGAMLNVSSISRVDNPDKVKSWGGYVLRNDGRSFVRDGEVVYLNGNDVIEEIEDPKYKLIRPINIKQLT